MQHFFKNRKILFFLISLFTVSICLYSFKKNERVDYFKGEGLVKYVDPLIGSDLHGHVFVGTSTPFGMVQLGPTNIFKGWDWYSGYHYSDSVLIGFSHTHLSGTGGSDQGDILIMPYTGKIRSAQGTQNDISNGYASYYSHAIEIARPEYYSVLLSSYNIKAELTSSDRVGFHKYTFPAGKQARVIVDLKEGIHNEALNSYIKQIDEYTLEGYRFSKGWSTHKCFFVLKSNTPIKTFTVFNDNEKKEGTELNASFVKGVMSFGDQGKEVMLKVGLSSVSCANAAKHKGYPNYRTFPCLSYTTRNRLVHSSRRIARAWILFNL